MDSGDQKYSKIALHDDEEESAKPRSRKIVRFRTRSWEKYKPVLALHLGFLSLYILMSIGLLYYSGSFMKRCIGPQDVPYCKYYNCNKEVSMADE